MVKSDGLDSLEMLALTNRDDDRARSEERGKNRRGSIRSRSVDPYLGRRHYPALMTQSYPPAGQVCPIPKTTEYRSQFAWPPGGVESTTDDKVTSPPRKSISMGAIQATKLLAEQRADEVDARTPCQDRSAVKAIEDQIIEDGIDKVEEPGKPKKFKTEYKARFKPPSKYTCVDGSWKASESQQLETSHPTDDALPSANWYNELIELRRKAGEYKVRAQGTALAPEHLSPVYLSHQEELWKQVAQRSSLSALALAATPSPRSDVGRSRVPTRHHLERTTPASGSTSSRSPKHTSRAQSVVPPLSAQRGHVSTAQDTKRQRPTSLASIPKPKSAPPSKSKETEELAKTHVVGRPKGKAKETKMKETEKVPSMEEEMNIVNGQNGLKNESELPSPPEVPSTIKSPELVPPIKSPPEPTRVKSPEQISAKSPEPVKWTIPLDTGIKWTDNLIIDGDSILKGHSKDELKISPGYHPPITDTGFYTNGDLLMSEEDN